MKKTFLDIVNKYFNKDDFNFKHILYDINGMVLCKTSDALFYLTGDMIDEVTSYCKDNGYDLDEITFVTSYDIDLSYKNRSVTKLDNGSLVVSRSHKMNSDSRLVVIRKDGRITAKVFMGSSVKIDQAHEKNS